MEGCVMSYRAYIEKGDGKEITVEDLFAISKILNETILPDVPKGFCEIQIRSSVFGSRKEDQYMHTTSLDGESCVTRSWLEKVLCAKVFLINLCIWPIDYFIRIHVRGLDGKGRNIVLVACCNDELYLKLREALERLFPGCYFDGKNDALEASERLDAKTWDPDAED
jgi:hypothetical protein